MSASNFDRSSFSTTAQIALAGWSSASSDSRSVGTSLT
jgi:hypothetical protein